MEADQQDSIHGWHVKELAAIIFSSSQTWKCDLESKFVSYRGLPASQEDLTNYKPIVRGSLALFG